MISAAFLLHYLPVATLAIMVLVLLDGARH